MKLKTVYTKDILIFAILVAIAFVSFFVLGTEVPGIVKDTHSYTEYTGNDAVMPLYPLFYYGIKMIFGTGAAYDAIVLIQGVFSSAITIWLAMYIRRRLDLDLISTTVTYCLLLVPFLTYLPQYNISQMILTEGLAFPFVYLMVFEWIRGFSERRIGHIIGSIAISIMLYMIRSQMLLAICLSILVLFVYLIIAYGNSIVKVLGKMALTILVLCISIVVASSLCKLYRKNVEPRIYNIDNIIEDRTEETSDADKISSGINGSQFYRMVCNRGLFLAREEDKIHLCADKWEQLDVAIESVEASNYSGLLKNNPINWAVAWDDQGLIPESTVDYAIAGLSEYYKNLYPDYSDVEIWSLVKPDIYEFSVTAITNHLGDYIMLFIRLAFAGLQAAIFAQPRGIYVLSEVITVVLWLLSIVLLIYKRGSKELSIQILRLSMLSIMVFVGAVSTIQLPLQRYLIYFQGFFYTGLFLVGRDILNRAIRETDNAGEQ